MTDHVPEASAVEALAVVLCHEYHPMHWDVGYGNRDKPCEACKIHAARVLASDWLAEHTRRAQAQALRAQADEFRAAERDGYLYLGDTSTPVPWEAVAQRIDSRADRIENGDSRG